METVPSVAVVVPTFERRDSVVRLVRSLETQTLGHDVFEVVVAVDGSTDGTAEALADLAPSFPLRVAVQPNAGRAAAVNLGLTTARAPLVVLLDDDMEPEPGCLAAHVAAHADGVPRCVVGAVPVVVPPGAPAITFFVASRFERHFRRLTEPGHRFGLRDFYSGHCSIDRTVLTELGAFDESFRVYGNEDLELFFRLRQARVPVVFDPRAVARQHYEKTLSQFARHTIAKGETAVLLAGLHPETVPDLQLSTYRHGASWWLALRRMLVVCAQVVDPVGPVSALVGLVARLRPASCERVLVLATNYLYWVGVERALRRNRARGTGLARLSS